MTTDCPKEYKNLKNESFGDQRYVTVEMLHQFCKNDSYLKSETEALWDTTPPVNRKRFRPVPLDNIKSYGIIESGEYLIFDDRTQFNISYNFNSPEFNMDLIDNVASTTIIRSELDNGNIVRKATIPMEKTSTVDKDSTRDYSPWTIRDNNGNIISDDMTCNEHWYIGFDKNRHYETRPNWLKDKYNGEIPSIVRAQTFKVKLPSGVNEAELESVILNLKGTYNTGVPLTVQIRRTELVNGVLQPKPTYDLGYKHLASEDIKFSNTDPGVYSVAFTNPPTLKKNETYAIVLLSSLSHSSNCYHVGGWSKYCQADSYPDGNAFLSENNGHTWIRYGKGDNVSYHQGQNAPQDFAFQCVFRMYDEHYQHEGYHYLYMKPIRCNPCYSMYFLMNEDYGRSVQGLELVYQYSVDGSVWNNVNGQTPITFSPDSSGEYPTLIFIRAKMKANTTGTDAPYIKNFGIHLDTYAAKKAYVRTHYYYPKLNGILGANVWSKINAKVELGDSCNAKVEIIRDKIVNEHYTIIKPLGIKNYTFLDDVLEAIPDITEFNALNTDIGAYEYLRDTVPELVPILQSHAVYIYYVPDSEHPTYTLFNTLNIKLINSPSEPLIYTGLLTTEEVNNETIDKSIDFGEYYDYTVNYDSNILSFKSSGLSKIDIGNLNIQYNPIFIKDLENKDFPLCLDLFYETFTISSLDIQNGYVELKTNPLDPLRNVILSQGTDTIELQEDVDYSVDYDNKKLIFNNSNILNQGDILEIKYTPNLDDLGISIGYYLNRTDTSKNSKILPNYIEYKT